MKLETAQEITAIINKLLTGADVYHVAIFVMRHCILTT